MLAISPLSSLSPPPAPLCFSAAAAIFLFVCLSVCPCASLWIALPTNERRLLAQLALPPLREGEKQNKMKKY